MDVFIIRTLADLSGMAVLYAYHIQVKEIQMRFEKDTLRNIMDMQYKNYKLSKESIDIVNQKYHDLVDVYGPDKVGLLTGDTSINSEADIVVMTTEVLRNMLYERSTTLNALRYVILDEVHYLADRFRGPVWEEVIIHLPKTVKIVGLSATVSNVEDFSNWIASVRGDTKLVISEHRPVPL